MGDYVTGLFNGTRKPSEPIAENDRKAGKFQYTDGSLADPFIQGLFGEKDLRSDFLRQQREAFQPSLRQWIEQIEKREKEKEADNAANSKVMYNID